MTEQPTDQSVSLSAIIAVRDGAAFLEEAIESILQQSSPPDEVIVVDDGSTDGSADIAARCGPGIRVVQQPPTGYAAAVNRGVQEAAGEVLGFLDADDRWAPGAVACRLSRLEEADAPDIAFGASVNFVSPEVSPEDAARLRIAQGAIHAEVLAAALIRRRSFEQVGPLAEDLRTGSAIDWISRARLIGLVFAPVPDTVLHRRIHSSNLGRTQQGARNRDLLQVVRAHHTRHRPDGAGTQRP